MKFRYVRRAYDWLDLASLRKLRLELKLRWKLTSILMLHLVNANNPEETKGCAILDFGATICVHRHWLQMKSRCSAHAKMSQVLLVLKDLDCYFRFTDGRTNAAQKVVEDWKIDRYAFNRPLGNETSPLFRINNKRRHRMVVDYEENVVMFKDKLDVWYTLPVTKKGLLMIPLTEEACG